MRDPNSKHVVVGEDATVGLSPPHTYAWGSAPAHTCTHMCTHTETTYTLREETKKADKGSAIMPRVSLGDLQVLAGDLVRAKGDPERMPDFQEPGRKGPVERRQCLGKQSRDFSGPRV